MIVLASTDSIRVTTSTANAMHVVVGHAVNAAAAFTPTAQPTVISAIATTTVVTAPAATTTANLSSLSFRAVGGANNIVVQFFNGTAFEIAAASLSSGDRLEYENGKGWTVNDSTGAIKYTVASGGIPGHLIRDDGVDETQRNALNFVSTAFPGVDMIVTDDAGNNESEVSASIAAMAANTVAVNATAGAAAPTALAMAASTILARLAAGNIVAATVAQLLTLLGAFATVNIQAFVTVGAATYTPTSGMKFCIVITTGSGGGGGGADNNAATAFFIGVGGGGGAGGTCIEAFSAATIGASQTVTIGAAGTAGSATNGTAGGAGGNSTFGALHTANGGAGGAGSGLSATLGQVAAGGLGGTPTGGTLNIIGGDGTDGWGIAVDGAVNDSRTLLAGDGGASFWGGGARAAAIQERTAGGAVAATSAGVNGRAFGAGASGASCTFSIAGAAGGVGALGCCLVIEFI